MNRRLISEPIADEALARLHASAFDDGWSAAYIESLRAQPGTLALADAAGTGMILLRAAADEAEILTLAVTPAARRRGLGRALVVAGADWAQSQGAQSLFLEVESGNIAAYTLYLNLGFVAIGRRPRYYTDRKGDRHDALVMSIQLPLLKSGNNPKQG